MKAANADRRSASRTCAFFPANDSSSTPFALNVLTAVWSCAPRRLKPAVVPSHQRDVLRRPLALRDGDDAPALRRRRQVGEVREAVPPVARRHHRARVDRACEAGLELLPRGGDRGFGVVAFNLDEGEGQVLLRRREDDDAVGSLRRSIPSGPRRSLPTAVVIGVSASSTFVSVTASPRASDEGWPADGDAGDGAGRGGSRCHKPKGAGREARGRVRVAHWRRLPRLGCRVKPKAQPCARRDAPAYTPRRARSAGGSPRRGAEDALRREKRGVLGVFSSRSDWRHDRVRDRLLQTPVPRGRQHGSDAHQPGHRHLAVKTARLVEERPRRLRHPSVWPEELQPFRGRELVLCVCRFQSRAP